MEDETKLADEMKKMEFKSGCCFISATYLVKQHFFLMITRT